MAGGTGTGPGDGGDGSFVRPFLDRFDRSPSRPPSESDAAAVRPYYLTGGRVGSADARVRIETMVLARPDAAVRLPPHAWEQQQLLVLAVRPISVVELSAALAVAVGVALVLVGDLARAGLVDLSNANVAPSDDVALIRRLIDGVLAL